MSWFLAAFIVGAIVFPVLARPLGRWVFLLPAALMAAAFVQACTVLPVAGGGGVVTEYAPWIPQLDIAFSFRMDALATILALVVTGVGALVFVYCLRYFARDDRGIPRFVGVLTGFAGSMYGLVLADDLLLFVIFWEATSIFSYLLIAQHYDRRASRGASLQALLITTLGGLAMLVGFLMLAVQAGTTSMSAILAAPPADIGLLPILLIVAGAVTKSALIPFHFWLPAAMAAPTPVSAYLHAAAMVKAGVYLVLRFGPAFAETPGWRESLLAIGLATMVFGAVQALRQVDLKLLLAYGTVSQLGMLVAVSGYGTAAMAAAGVVLLLSHALFKSTLFLAVGAIDHACETRDIRRLSGVGRRLPVLATASVLAVVSMAGLPPALGFVGKEAAYTALIDDAVAGSWLAVVVLAVLAIGSALTLAYGLRFLVGAFARKPGLEPTSVAGSTGGDGPVLVGPSVVLAGLGVVLGPFAAALDPIVAGAVDGYPGRASLPHLEFWHGWQPALLVSAGVLVVGVASYLLAARRLRIADAPASPAALAYTATVTALDRLAHFVTGITQRGSLPFYLGVIFLVTIGATGVALTAVRDWPEQLVLAHTPVQPIIGLLMIVAAIATVRSTKRFQAAILLGVSGIGMATLFATQGAPDLALTQVLVEIVTLVTFVLVLRRLPARIGERNASRHRVKRMLAGVGVGLTMAVVGYLATSSRVGPPASEDWPWLASEVGHGENVVNVALVDIRGWDTMGELAVVIAAATGVASLIFVRSRADQLPRIPGVPARTSLRARVQQVEPGLPARRRWLLGGATLEPQRRSIMLEVVVRLIFHALMVVSLFVLLVGHNAPGGGFAGGLIAGLALCLRYLAGGRFELAAAAVLDAGKTLGAGLLLATGAAIVPLFVGADALTSTWFTIDLGFAGTIDFVSSTIFDIGVYLVVVGLVLDILRSLGGEVDRQAEEELSGAVS